MNLANEIMRTAARKPRDSFRRVTTEGQRKQLSDEERAEAKRLHASGQLWPPKALAERFGVTYADIKRELGL